MTVPLYIIISLQGLTLLKTAALLKATPASWVPHGSDMGV